MAILASEVGKLTSEELLYLRKVENYIDDELRKQNRNGITISKIFFGHIETQFGRLNPRLILELSSRYQKVGWKVDVVEPGTEKVAFRFEPEPIIVS